MSKSKFEYVKGFEVDDRLLPNCWIVVRIDGKGFHKFTHEHEFIKPNDVRGLGLMNKCAETVFREFADIILAYGESDEYSFVFAKDTNLFTRRASKIMTTVVSLFASSFVMFWPEFFPTKKIKYPPTFDSRTVLYPSDQNLRDYLSWRQADTHINNLYNTTFWTLIQKGNQTPQEAEKTLSGTISEQKNEILFNDYQINYNNEPAMFRKGSIIITEYFFTEIVDSRNHQRINKLGKEVRILHEDLISEKFWKDRPWLLENKKPKLELLVKIQKTPQRPRKEEGNSKGEKGNSKKEEGNSKKEEGNSKKEEGNSKKEEGNSKGEKGKNSKGKNSKEENSKEEKREEASQNKN